MVEAQECFIDNCEMAATHEFMAGEVTRWMCDTHCLEFLAYAEVAGVPVSHAVVADLDEEDGTVN